MQRGIDISQYNTVKDLKAAKEAGYEFCIIRCTGFANQAKNTMPYKDNKFEKHYALAKEAGLKVGAYAYVAPIPGVDPKKHAEFVLDVLKGKSFEYPFYIDVEAWKHYDKFGRTIYVHDFLQEIEKHNAFVGVYGSDISTFKDMLSLDLKDENMLPIMKHYTWWVARYGSKPQYATKNMHIWQFSSKGKVPGITGNVDLNECYQDFSVIERKGMNRF